MNDHESLWSGVFGDEYTERNKTVDDWNIRARESLFAEIFRLTQPSALNSIAEIGAGGGANLVALRRLFGDRPRLIAVEPNESARTQILSSCSTTAADVINAWADALPFQDNSIDAVFTSGVLIHVAPNHLGAVMDEIHRVAGRYIICAEYFSPELRCIPYRGLGNALWANDFGSAYLSRFEDLCSCDYGFAWRRATGLDNLTWHLMEKRPC